MGDPLTIDFYKKPYAGIALGDWSCASQTLARRREWHVRRVKAPKEVIEHALELLWRDEIHGGDTPDAARFLGRFIETAKPDSLLVSFVNLAAPSVVRAPTLALLYEFVGGLTNHFGENAIVCTIRPMCTTDKGGCHRAEALTNKELYDSGLNVDRNWCLVYHAHENIREERPLMIPSNPL